MMYSCVPAGVSAGHGSWPAEKKRRNSGAPLEFRSPLCVTTKQAKTAERRKFPPFRWNLRNSGVLCGCQTTPKILRAAVIYFQVAFTPKEARKNRRCRHQMRKIASWRDIPYDFANDWCGQNIFIVESCDGQPGFYTFYEHLPPRRTIPIFAQWPSQNSLNISIIHREDYDYIFLSSDGQLDQIRRIWSRD